MSLMRVYPALTVSGEFKKLGELGFTGSLNDRQFKALVDAGYTGALPDMMYKFYLDGGEYPEGEPIPGGSISPTSITVQEGVAFSQQFTASGGTGPYTWSIVSGTLPGGLTLSTDTISGTPTGVEGDPYSFTIRATDSTGDYIDQAIIGAIEASGLSPRWRMNITANTGGPTDLIFLYELQFRSEVGGVDLTSPAEAVARASASSVNSSGFEADKAFDDDNSTRWIPSSATLPQWIEWEFAAPVTIVEIAWLASATSNSPEDFDIQYYDANLATWQTYWSETGQVSSASLQTSSLP